MNGLWCIQVTQCYSATNTNIWQWGKSLNWGIVVITEARITAHKPHLWTPVHRGPSLQHMRCRGAVQIKTLTGGKGGSFVTGFLSIALVVWEIWLPLLPIAGVKGVCHCICKEWFYIFIVGTGAQLCTQEQRQTLNTRGEKSPILKSSVDQLTVIGSCQFVNSDVFLEFCYTIGESWVKNKWGVWHCICNLWV